MKRAVNVFALMGLALTSLAGTAYAQAAPAAQASYPARAVTIVVPFPPGGGADTLARLLGARLSEKWGQQVVVDNRPGASGHIGASFVARSAPDGYTLVMASTAALDEKNVTQFAPISLVSASSYVVTVGAKKGIKSIKELVAYAKANPDLLTFGSSGTGAASHLSVELFNQQADVKMMHIPYKGTGQAVTDLLSGNIDVMFAPAQTIVPHLESGKLQALAVTSAERSKVLPNLPTVAEAGVPGYAAVGWFGLLAPAGTSPAIIKKINADVTETLSEPEVVKSLLIAGAEPSTGTSEEFDRFINSELTKWTGLMKGLGLTSLR
jgi:tripartite-type tricarboxylate transporter receptor subunit TctC